MIIRFNPVVLIYAVVFGTPALFTITYLIAAWYGHVPWCFPPLDGCTTITEIGTHAPESYVFRFGAYPLLTVQAGVLYFFKQWLEQGSGKSPRLGQCAWLLGLTGCASMIGSMAVMQGAEIAEPVHTILALAYYVLMLVSQSLFTFDRLPPAAKSEPNSAYYSYGHFASAGGLGRQPPAALVHCRSDTERAISMAHRSYDPVVVLEPAFRARA